nr:hypothetical protein [Escherichia coli]
MARYSALTVRAAGRQVQGFAATSRGAFRDIATGGAALWGVGAAIQGALMPAIEMDRALGEVKSLGVAESGLRKLSRAAVDFTMEYGGAAQDFVRASYDIQSAIAGLRSLKSTDNAVIDGDAHIFPVVVIQPDGGSQ